MAHAGAQHRGNWGHAVMCRPQPPSPGSDAGPLQPVGRGRVPSGGATLLVHCLTVLISSWITRSTHFRHGSFSFTTCFFTIASNAMSGVKSPVLAQVREKQTLSATGTPWSMARRPQGHLSTSRPSRQRPLLGTVDLQIPRTSTPRHVPRLGLPHKTSQSGPRDLPDTVDVLDGVADLASQVLFIKLHLETREPRWEGSRCWGPTETQEQPPPHQN